MTDHLPGLLALAVLAAVTARVVRHRHRGALDAVLVGVGGLLVALVLTGMVLGVSGVGLRTATWTGGLAVLAVLGLVADRVLALRAPVAQRQDPSPRVAVPALLRALLWVVASVVVLVVAIGTSVRSLSAADVPPLELSIGSVDGTDVEVVASSGEAVGPLEVRTEQDGTEISYPLFSLTAGDTETTTLSLPRHGRVTITLNYPDQTQPLRTLVLDR